MDFTIENTLLTGSLLIFASIVVGKTSHCFGVPILLLSVTVGMLAGSNGIGPIFFDGPKIARFIGVVMPTFI